MGRILEGASDMMCVAKYDAYSGAGSKHAQMKAAYCCYMEVLVSNPNSNKEVFCDAHHSADGAIPLTAQNTNPARSLGVCY